MIQILQIQILLPQEVSRVVDITTDETPKDYCNSIKAELLQFGINAEVTISYRDLDDKTEMPKTKDT